MLCICFGCRAFLYPAHNYSQPFKTIFTGAYNQVCCRFNRESIARSFISDVSFIVDCAHQVCCCDPLVVSNVTPLILLLTTSSNSRMTQCGHTSVPRTCCFAVSNAPVLQIAALTTLPIAVAETTTNEFYGGQSLDKAQWLTDFWTSITYDFPRVREVTFFLYNKNEEGKCFASSKFNSACL